MRRGESREFGIEIKEKQAENYCGVQLNFCKREGDSATERDGERRRVSEFACAEHVRK